MHSSRVAAIIVVLGMVAGTSGCGGSGSPAAAIHGVFAAARTGALPPATVRALNRALTRDARAAGLDVTVAVVTARGTWQAAVGVDGLGRPLQPTDELAVGSVSKTFTAAEVMHLVDQHKIDLDAPLSRYVSSPLLVHSPTVRQVLSMRSGIDPGADDQGTLYTAQEALAERAPDSHTSPDRVLAADTVRPGSPGPYRYSNTGYELLGLAVQRVTGQSLATRIRQDLLGPADLRRTVVQDAQRPPAPLAYPIAAGGGTPRTDGFLPDRAVSSAAVGAGSMASDAPDLARWGYELYGSRLLPAADVRQMTTAVGASDYGLGTETFGRQLSSADTVGHNGLIRGHGPKGSVSYTALLAVDRTAGIAVAVLSPDDRGRDQIPLAGDLFAAMST